MGRNSSLSANECELASIFGSHPLARNILVQLVPTALLAKNQRLGIPRITPRALALTDRLSRGLIAVVSSPISPCYHRLHCQRYLPPHLHLLLVLLFDTATSLLASCELNPTLSLTRSPHSELSPQ